MKFGIAFFRIVKGSVLKTMKSIELNKYDRFTISEYFRKQGAQIGKGCSIIPRSLGSEPYLVKIGDNVTIARDVSFITHDGAAWVFRKEIPNLQVFGKIEIGDNCVIGKGAILFPNIKIGKNSIVGAGSVVISDIPENTVAIGVPARAFGSLDKYKEKCLARWQEQCPPDYVIENGETWWDSKHYEGNRAKLKNHLIKLFWGNDYPYQAGEGK